MTATISFELKPIMKYLARDDRWNVLTVLILHANIRNRCYPSMQTIADMATNGNLHKATDAKKWLEKHGAFELVAYGKRVDDEKNCGKRQHIYQLTGVLKACANPECDCWHKGEYRFLYFNKQGVPDIAPVDNITTGNVVPTDNITVPDVAPVSNIKEADIVPTEIINGYKGSIPKTSKPKEQIQESASAPAPADKKANGFAVFEALVKALGYQQSDIGKTLKTQLFKIAHDLMSSENPVKPEEVASLVTFAKRGEKDGKFSIWWITPKVGEWRKWQREQKSTPSSSGAVSPNGEKNYSANNPANAWVKPKAS